MVRKSECFERFVDSFDITSRERLEDYDIEALMGLEGDEFDEAISILINRLVETSDQRAPRALRYISCERAIPELEKCLSNKTGFMLVECAFSLWRLTGDNRAVDALIEVLSTPAYDDEVGYGRPFAAYYLRNIPGDEVDFALINALSDDNMLVRSNAINSLLALYDIEDWSMVSGRGLKLIIFRINIQYQKIRMDAVKEFVNILNLKKEGKSAEDIGLTIVSHDRSPAAQKLIKSYRFSEGQTPVTDEYDMEAFSELEGEEVEWATYVFFSKIEDGDFRAVRALVHINNKVAPEVFREALPSAEGRLLVELIWGLWKLSDDKSNRELLTPYLNSEDDRLKARANEIFSELS